MTEPDALLLADPSIPTIVLAGKSWPVPHLAPRQNRIVGPLLIERIRGISKLTTEAVDDLTTIAFWALQRGHRALTREEFDEMPVGIDELLAALGVIGKQTGLFRDAKPGENGTPLPLADTTSPTGTP